MLELLVNLAINNNLEVIDKILTNSANFKGNLLISLFDFKFKFDFYFIIVLLGLVLVGDND